MGSDTYEYMTYFCSYIEAVRKVRKGQGAGGGGLEKSYYAVICERPHRTRIKHGASSSFPSFWKTKIVVNLYFQCSVLLIEVFPSSPRVVGDFLTVSRGIGWPILKSDHKVNLFTFHFYPITQVSYGCLPDQILRIL